MAAPASRIYDVCVDLLAAVTTHHGATLPDRQFVSAGPPAFDCELVAVHCEATVGGISPDLAGVADPMTASAAHAMRVGTFVVTIVRCAPTVDSEGAEVVIPTEVEEDEAARVLYEDAQRTLNAVLAAEREGSLAACNSVAFAGWRVVGPDGGLVAGELRVAVGLATGL